MSLGRCAEGDKGVLEGYACFVDLSRIVHAIVYTTFENIYIQAGLLLYIRRTSYPQLLIDSVLQ